jgi:hypothetical protein
MTDIQKLAEIVEIIILQDLYKHPKESGVRLVYQQAIDILADIRSKGDE